MFEESHLRDVDDGSHDHQLTHDSGDARGYRNSAETAVLQKRVDVANRFGVHNLVILLNKAVVKWSDSLIIEVRAHR
jgi:hypothetical protein